MVPTPIRTPHTERTKMLLLALARLGERTDRHSFIDIAAASANEAEARWKRGVQFFGT